MAHTGKICRDQKWYVAHEILYAEMENFSIEDNVLVWENLILIEAKTPEEAYEKAMHHGRMSEDEISINGVKGHLRFKGLKDLVLVYDDLEDGVEIEWHEHQMRMDTLDCLIKSKEDLHAFNLTQPDEQA